MELFIQGHGSVSLSQADFVAQGGQASVYARGGTAFKIYTDPADMIPLAKIRELSALTRPCVIRPEDVLLDTRNRPVGYTMRRVDSAHVLCELFNRSFRERHRITPEAILERVQKLQHGIRHVHQHSILIVDLNEMNFLVDAPLQEVLFIDVDSYQTPGFPATAIMDSIRDRHAQAFSEGTDWFAFAVVSFQMFVGIHPYRGKHPSLADLDARMQANVSVLNPEVSVPSVCYPFEVIPSGYLEWYRAVLDGGRRVPPPSDPQAAILVPASVQRLPAGDHLMVRELRRFGAAIVSPVPLPAEYAGLTTAGLEAGGRVHPVPPEARIGRTPRMGRLVAAWIERGALRLYDAAAGRLLPEEIAAQDLTSYQGRIYFRSVDRLNELEWVELPAGPRATWRPCGNVMEHATRLFDGVAVQSILGACYVSVFPTGGQCCQLRVPELDGYQVVDARFDRGVLMLMGARRGQYDRFILRLAPGHREYDLEVTADVTPSGLNFVTLESCVCVHLNEDEELELFSSRKGSGQRKVIADPALRGARLFTDGARVLFCLGETLYAMSMKS